jgi:hypothetical protein
MPKAKTKNQGGQICHSLQSESDWNLFRLSLVQADKTANRKRLEGCAFSAEMLGMWVVARIKTAKVAPRKQAVALYDSALKRLGIDSVLSSCLPDSYVRMCAIDEIEDIFKAMLDANDSLRSKLAESAWETAYHGAKDSLADECYGDLFND